MNPELIKYVAEARRSGLSDETIRSNLLGAGWDAKLVDEALGHSTPAAAIGTPPAIQQSTPITTSTAPAGTKPMVSASTKNFFSATTATAPTQAAPAGTANGLTSEQSAFITRWSWGGFLLYCFYFLGNGLYGAALLYFLGQAVPLLDLYLWFRAGSRGRKIAWEKKIWKDFASYERRQRLLDKIGFVFATLVLILVIGGTTALFLFGTHGPANVKPTATTAPAATSSAPTPEAIVGKLNVATTTGAQDCGSIRDEVMGYATLGFPPLSSPITTAETAALNCIDKAVVACTPATLTVTTKDGDLKEQVLGSTGNNCTITSANNPKTATTCQVPSSTIQSMVLAAQKKKTTQEGALSMNIMMIVSMASTPGFTLKDPQGKPIKLDCKIPPPTISVQASYNPADMSEGQMSTGPITITGPIFYFHLQWDGNGLASSCVPFGSWGTSTMQRWTDSRGDLSFNAPFALGHMDLEKTFAAHNFTPTNADTKEYTFGLTCSNSAGDASSSVKVYLK
ncbi:MAG TPA: hypothetical protein VMC43_02160 [Candidatus Paceibacterota bacterium]|nr:hypothetical protein [Candidatus Paceibacterota bacterium]